MTVNLFMITDYTELLQLVDLAAGQSGVVKMAASKRKRSCAWNYFEKVENDDPLALCKLCEKTIVHSNTTSNVN